MANWLWSLLLLFALCANCPAPTIERSLHFSQEAILVSTEPDPDADLRVQSFILVETTSVESHDDDDDDDDEETPFASHISEHDEESLTLGLISSFVGKPAISLNAAKHPLSFQDDVAAHDTEENFEGPKVPSSVEDSSIASLLNQNGLPIGLLPSSVESYTLSDDGQFSVTLPKACYVDFDYEVYYAPTITGTLSYGAISDLSGIQAKKAFLWLAVTGIRADESSSSYIYFDVGPFSKKLSISQFESVPVCKAKAINLSTLA